MYVCMHACVWLAVQGPREPTVDELEAEFWRLVERPQPGQVVETLYGSDLDSGK